jgi:predicted transcriptional regulator
MKVVDLMSRPVETCSPEDSLTLRRNACGCIPVVDDEVKPVGMITDRDITA